MSSAEVEATVEILQVLTSDADTLTMEETNNAAEFIVDVTLALNKNQAEV